MKITGTRSYILIEYDHRTVKVSGELTVTPTFYASIGSIKNWEPPYENIGVTELEKEEIIRQVLAQNNVGVKIIFEE